MKYRFIQDHREAFPVSLMCRALQVSGSGFYTWLNRPKSPRSRENQNLIVEIKNLHQKSRQTYGSPRVHADLKSKGYVIGRHSVARLMRMNGVVSIHKRKFRVTTNSKHNHPVAENKLQWRFHVSGPGQCWISDITYIPTREGWLYLAITVDLFHRKVIGWAMDRCMTRWLVMRALNMAMKNGDMKPGLVHHSDRGVQYACRDFQALLEIHGIECSMSRKGNCWDNAVAESFFHTLKVELIHNQSYKTRQQAQANIFEYIELCYNRQRRHSYLGYLSPVDFEQANAS
jgi:putative transposase